MIVKEKVRIDSDSPLLIAGQKAELNMAHFLKREFATDANIWVFHDLRIQVSDDDYAQIDHLLMHPRGFFIIESKSVCDSVEVNEYGEWTRWFNRKPSGMPSPVEQAKRQAKVLFDKLQSNRESLRHKILGIKQAGFTYKPIDIIVAVSTNGRITGNGRSQFGDTVMKADLVCSQIRSQINEHLKSKNLESFKDEECAKIVRFIQELHTPKKLTEESNVTYSVAEKVTTVEASEPSPQIANDYWHCQCGGTFDIRYANTARYGKSYYRYCPDCRARKKLDARCPKCQSDVSLNLTERLVIFICETERSHQGIYYRNNKLWVKDKNALAKEKS